MTEAVSCRFPILATRSEHWREAVRDIVLLDGVLSGDDSNMTDMDLADVTVGIPRQTYFDNLDPIVERAIEAQLAALSAFGVRLVEIDLASIQPHNDAFSFPVAFYEVVRDLPAYLAEHAPDVSFETLVAGIGSPDVAQAIGSQLGDGAISDAAYRSALDQHRPAMRRIYGPHVRGARARLDRFPDDTASGKTDR